MGTVAYRWRCYSQMDLLEKEIKDSTDSVRAVKNGTRTSKKANMIESSPQQRLKKRLIGNGRKS